MMVKRKATHQTSDFPRLSHQTNKLNAKKHGQLNDDLSIIAWCQNRSYDIIYIYQTKASKNIWSILCTVPYLGLLYPKETSQQCCELWAPIDDIWSYEGSQLWASCSHVQFSCGSSSVQTVHLASSGTQPEIIAKIHGHDCHNQHFLLIRMSFERLSGSKGAENDLCEARALFTSSFLQESAVILGTVPPIWASGGASILSLASLATLSTWAWSCHCPPNWSMGGDEKYRYE